VKHTADIRSERVNPKREAEDIKRLRYPGYRELFKKLLYFKHFVVLDKPLLVCEGKTDSIYLRSALFLLSRKAHGPLANFILARRGCELVGVKIPTF
jgi:hypothetical protein